MIKPNINVFRKKQSHRLKTDLHLYRGTEKEKKKKIRDAIYYDCEQKVREYNVYAI